MTECAILMLGQSEFLAFFPKTVELIRADMPDDVHPLLDDHLTSLIEYTVPGGKCIRGSLAAATYLEALGIEPSDPKAPIGYLAGWAIEYLQAGFLVADDVMDGALVRRGKNCWYKEDAIGLMAVNDSIILENISYILLDRCKDYGATDSTVFALKDILRRTTTITTFGQALDTMGGKFNFEYYNAIVTNKTAYYTIWSPYVLGLTASAKFAPEIVLGQAIKDATLCIGILFQVQDDWIDIYVDPSVSGKVGTDIIDKKVTWFACKAFELGNEQQVARLQAGLGNDEADVKALYNELELEKHFFAYQDEKHAAILSMIAHFDSSIPHSALDQMLAKLVNRKF